MLQGYFMEELSIRHRWERLFVIKDSDTEKPEANDSDICLRMRRQYATSSLHGGRIVYEFHIHRENLSHPIAPLISPLS